MGLSDLWKDGLVNHWLGTAGAPVALPVVHLQVYVVLPLPDGSGGVVPAGADGYIGPVDVSGAVFWPASTGGSGDSLIQADVDFGTPSADWGLIVGAAFTEADGSLITIAEEFSSPYDVTVGVPFVLPAGTVDFQAL